MTVRDKTPADQGEFVVFEAELAHPPSKVWRALTEPQLLAEWLLPSLGFDLEMGTAFTLNAPPRADWDGRVDCQFTEIEVLQKLSYTWRAFDIDTVVTFTLTSVPSGTRLTVVQSGFQATQKRNFGGARYGWKLMCGRLEELLARTE